MNVECSFRDDIILNIDPVRQMSSDSTPTSNILKQAYQTFSLKIENVSKLALWKWA